MAESRSSSTFPPSSPACPGRTPLPDERPPASPRRGRALATAVVCGPAAHNPDARVEEVRLAPPRHAVDTPSVTPETILAQPPSYARTGGLHIAYRVVGNGPIDLVLVDQWFSNV